MYIATCPTNVELLATDGSENTHGEYVFYLKPVADFCKIVACQQQLSIRIIPSHALSAFASEKVSPKDSDVHLPMLAVLSCLSRNAWFVLIIFIY